MERIEKKERRKFIRFNAPFYIRYNDLGLSQEVSGVIKDISYGGARVLLDTSLDSLPSSLVSLFILILGSPLKISGKVIWVRNSGDKKEIGICFVNIPDSYKEDIYSCIFKYHRQELTYKWWQP